MPQQKSRESERILQQTILTDPDKGAEELFRRYGSFIRNLIANFELGREDREEVFQEISHNLAKKGFQAIRVWNPEKGSLANYLAVITVRTTITFLKSGYHTQSRLSSTPPDPNARMGDPVDYLEKSTLSPRQRLHRLSVSRLFEEALNRLLDRGEIRDQDRNFLILRAGGLTYKEIERIVGIPEKTASRNFSRLKPMVRTELLNLGFSMPDID